MNSDPKFEAVIKAMQNPKWKWRTIGSIAKETGLAPEDVAEVLRSHSDLIVRSSQATDEGEELFTTREQFKAKTPFTHKILGAFKNRAD